MSGDLAFLYSAVEEVVIATEANLFVKHSVRELLFDGYEDDLLYIGKDLGISSAPITGRFGWFHLRNGSSTDGVYEMNTGMIDGNRFGYMESWNYKPQLDVWQND